MSIADRHPEALVQTDWLEAHLRDPDLRIDECTAYLRYAETGRACRITRNPAARTTKPATFRGRLPRPADDVLLVGGESCGVPEVVHAAADLRVRMAPGRRSLNVVTAHAMVLGAALPQTGGFARNVEAGEFDGKDVP
jgi:tRNA(Leu) C34 or U34 (ribose-2'-O)-methylase TrmL